MDRNSAKFGLAAGYFAQRLDDFDGTDAWLGVERSCPIFIFAIDPDHFRRQRSRNHPCLPSIGLPALECMRDRFWRLVHYGDGSRTVLFLDAGSQNAAAICVVLYGSCYNLVFAAFAGLVTQIGPEKAKPGELPGLE